MSVDAFDRWWLLRFLRIKDFFLQNDQIFNNFTHSFKIITEYVFVDQKCMVLGYIFTSWTSSHLSCVATTCIVFTCDEILLWSNRKLVCDQSSTVSNWPHELVLSIRGDKADAPLRVKFTETDTLVESAVIDGYGLLPTVGTENTADTQKKSMNFDYKNYLSYFMVSFDNESLQHKMLHYIYQYSWKKWNKNMEHTHRHVC